MGPPPRRGPDRDADVLLGGQAAEQPPSLRDEHHARPGPLVVGQAGDVGAVQHDAAAPGPQRPGDRHEQRGLARPVRPHQGDGLPRGQIQAHPEQRLEVLIPGVQAADGQSVHPTEPPR